LNAYAERWVKSVKEKALSKLILFGEASLGRVLREYLVHYMSNEIIRVKATYCYFQPPRKQIIVLTDQLAVKNAWAGWVLGEGPEAEKGDVVAYNARFFLRQGDEVTRDGEIISKARDHPKTHIIDEVELVDHVTELGKRRSIAGVEKSLYRMRKNGYRDVLVSPHLACGEDGVPDLIPANALLRIQLWVQDVRKAT